MKGWYGNKERHRLASKGVKTKASGYTIKEYDGTKTTKPESIQDLARYFESKFVQKERDDGEKFWDAEDRPEELKELIYDAHDDMLPDDWRYQFIWESLVALSEYEDPDEAIEGIEPDMYTSQLTEWLNSRNDRVYYLTEAQRNYGSDDGFQTLSQAQYEEKSEVFWSVKNSLEKILDNWED